MFRKKRENKENENNNTAVPNTNQQINCLTESLDDNIALFKKILFNDDTLIIRQFQNKYLKSAKGCIIFIDNMADFKILNESIIRPFLESDLTDEIFRGNLLQEIQNKVIFSNTVNMKTDLDEIVSSVLYGDTIFLLDGYDSVLVINSKGWETRAISEPTGEKVVRGPREGFNESILTNITLIRRRIKTPGLKLKYKEIGEITRTRTCICYIEEIVSKNILQELERRLNEINIDGIIDSGYIQELIRDAPFSPFQTVGSSERPDVIAAKLLEGRIAVIVDGSPTVLTVPFVLAEATQVSEDYYNNYIFASINRFLRTMGAIFSVTVPSFYLAVATYHFEMLPTPLLLSIYASRQGVPIPTALSLFVMLLIFDILREAGTRMPAVIGQAVNIVGALVLGEAAVQAKLVSAPVIIVTALTGILTFLNINLMGALITARFFVLLATSIFGAYGLIFSIVLITLHLMSIRSFGVPYALNLSRARNHNGQDVWIRAPWWVMTLRPKIMSARNLTRQNSKKERK